MLCNKHFAVIVLVFEWLVLRKREVVVVMLGSMSTVTHQNTHKNTHKKGHMMMVLVNSIPHTSPLAPWPFM